MTPKRNWRDLFLAKLSGTGNVRLSCRAASVSRQTAYRHREEEPEFKRGWDEALEEAADVLEAEAVRRASKGTLKPVFYKGEECGHVREYSDTLLIFLLKGARPDKYRERVQTDLNHSGDLTIRVQYADPEGSDADPAAAPCGPASGDPGGAAV